MDHKAKALNYFSQKMHCSQSVIAAVEIDEEIIAEEGNKF